MHARVTNDDRSLEPTALPAPVTGVARAGQGTGTALDDTQVYDVADFTAASAAAEAVARDPGMPNEAPQPAPPVEPAPSVEPAAVAPVPRAAPQRATRPRTSTDRKPRVASPVAGLVGFAIAAGLAILIGASLGGFSIPGGAANVEATPRATATSVPAATEKADGGGEGNGKGGNGKGNGNGNGKGNGNND